MLIELISLNVAQVDLVNMMILQ